MPERIADNGGRGADRRAVDSVMRALDFVEEAHGRDIGLADMAEAACYSPFYFSRVFAQATGHSPYDYLMRRRSALAAEDLLGTEASVIDIALARGFGSPDAFSRAFRRCFGTSPSEARREGTYPKAIARNRIGIGFVREALSHPMPPPEKAISGSFILDGSVSPSSPLTDGLSVAQRDGVLGPRTSFAGRVRGGDERCAPDFPSAAVRIPAGSFARFAAGGSEERLSAIIEYAYRSWLPLSGSTLVPDFDLIEWAGGRPVSVSLRLGPPEGGAKSFTAGL